MQNANGQIAMKRLRQNPARVEMPSGKVYEFIPRNGVCLSWVDPADVPRVLATLRHCCGGAKAPGVRQFYLANEQDVRIHGGY